MIEHIHNTLQLLVPFLAAFAVIPSPETSAIQIVECHKAESAALCRPAVLICLVDLQCGQTALRINCERTAGEDKAATRSSRQLGTSPWPHVVCGYQVSECFQVESSMHWEAYPCDCPLARSTALPYDLLGTSLPATPRTASARTRRQVPDPRKFHHLLSDGCESC